MIEKLNLQQLTDDLLPIFLKHGLTGMVGFAFNQQGTHAIRIVEPTDFVTVESCNAVFNTLDTILSLTPGLSVDYQKSMTGGSRPS